MTLRLLLLEDGSLPRSSSKRNVPLALWREAKVPAFIADLLQSALHEVGALLRIIAPLLQIQLALELHQGLQLLDVIPGQSCISEADVQRLGVVLGLADKGGRRETNVLLVLLHKLHPDEVEAASVDEVPLEATEEGLHDEGPLLDAPDEVRCLRGRQVLQQRGLVEDLDNLEDAHPWNGWQVQEGRGAKGVCPRSLPSMRGEQVQDVLRSELVANAFVADHGFVQRGRGHLGRSWSTCTAERYLWTRVSL